MGPKYAVPVTLWLEIVISNPAKLSAHGALMHLVYQIHLRCQAFIHIFMKTFKTLISEIVDIKSTEGISPYTEKIVPGVSVTRTYKTKIGDNEILTHIDHSLFTDKSDIKFFVNGSLERFKNPKSTSEALQVYNTVLSHIKHHIENPPSEIKAIKYSYKDDVEGRKKHRLYQSFGKRFDIKLEPRVA